MGDKKDRIIKLDGKEINLSKLSNDELLKLAEYLVYKSRNGKKEVAEKIKELKEDIRELD